MKSNTILHGSNKYQKPWSGFVCHGWGVLLILSISSPPDISESNLLRLACFITFSAFIFPNSSTFFPAVPYHLILQILLLFLLSMAMQPTEKNNKLDHLISFYPWQWPPTLTAFPSKYLKEKSYIKMISIQKKNDFSFLQGLAVHLHLAELSGASAACRHYIRCRRRVATRPDPGSLLSSWGLGSGFCPGALAWSTPRTWALP